MTDTGGSSRRWELAGLAPPQGPDEQLIGCPVCPQTYAEDMTEALSEGRFLPQNLTFTGGSCGLTKSVLIHFAGHKRLPSLSLGEEILAQDDNFLIHCLHNLGVGMEAERPIRRGLSEEWNPAARGGGS